MRSLAIYILQIIYVIYMNIYTHIYVSVCMHASNICYISPEMESMTDQSNNCTEI